MTMSELAPQIAGEWHYPVQADEIVAGKAVKVSIAPSDQERAALSNRLGLYALNSLKADLRLQRNPGNMVIHIMGKIMADVVQQCIVTLEPVSEHIEEEFESWFADQTQAVSFNKAKRDRLSIKEKGEQPMMEEYDDPESIVDGRIDLGELVAQHLSLCLNPYPRAQGAWYEKGDDEVRQNDTENQGKNPFAALKDWKAKEGKKEH